MENGYSQYLRRARAGSGRNCPRVRSTRHRGKSSPARPSRRMRSCSAWSSKRATSAMARSRISEFSFGANYSAMTGLLGVVDASVVLGGPIDRAFTKEALEKLPYGMPDIVSNAMGFDHPPTMQEFVSAAAKLSRRALLEQADNAPMLVINGENDYFVPQADTRVFEGRRKPRRISSQKPDTAPARSFRTSCRWCSAGFPSRLARLRRSVGRRQGGSATSSTGRCAAPGEVLGIPC